MATEEKVRYVPAVVQGDTSESDDDDDADSGGSSSFTDSDSASSATVPSDKEDETPAEVKTESVPIENQEQEVVPKEDADDLETQLRKKAPEFHARARGTIRTNASETVGLAAEAVAWAAIHTAARSAVQTELGSPSASVHRRPSAPWIISPSAIFGGALRASDTRDKTVSSPDVTATSLLSSSTNTKSMSSLPNAPASQQRSAASVVSDSTIIAGALRAATKKARKVGDRTAAAWYVSEGVMRTAAARVSRVIQSKPSSNNNALGSLPLGTRKENAAHLPVIPEIGEDEATSSTSIKWGSMVTRHGTGEASSHNESNSSDYVTEEEEPELPPKIKTKKRVQFRTTVSAASKASGSTLKFLPNPPEEDEFAEQMEWINKMQFEEYQKPDPRCDGSGGCAVCSVLRMPETPSKMKVTDHVVRVYGGKDRKDRKVLAMAGVEPIKHKLSEKEKRLQRSFEKDWKVMTANERRIAAERSRPGFFRSIKRVEEIFFLEICLPAVLFVWRRVLCVPWIVRSGKIASIFFWKKILRGPLVLDFMGRSMVFMWNRVLRVPRLLDWLSGFIPWLNRTYRRIHSGKVLPANVPNPREEVDLNQEVDANQEEVLDQEEDTNRNEPEVNDPEFTDFHTFLRNRVSKKDFKLYEKESKAFWKKRETVELE